MGNRTRRLTEKEEELYKYYVCNRLVENQTRRLPDSRAGASTNPGNGLNLDNTGASVPQRTKETETKMPTAIRRPDNIIPFRTSTFQYDNQGNLLREERKTEENRQESIYSYDGFNRQKKIINFESKVQVNHYDGEGLRHEMEENGKLVKFLYNDREAVAEEKEDGNTIRYIRGYDLVASDSESARTYYHYASDEQGSITHVLGEDGNGSYGLRNYYEYGAFGDFREKEEETENRFGYNGEIFDPIGGQYYLRARYYNPVIGRFTQEDTYYGDGLNLYAYCSNLPVGYEDPSGHEGTICDKKAALLEKKKAEEGLTKKEQRQLDKYYEAQAQGNKKNNGLYSDQELIDAAKKIHNAQYGDAWWGKKNPVCVTQAADGTIVITKNNGVIGKRSREMARAIFGDDAIIVSGRGKNYDNSRWEYSTPEPKHAEARAIQALKSMGIDVEGARQATTLLSCDACSALQNYYNIINLTGSR